MNVRQSSAVRDLPVEPRSGSEILSATHIFEVEIATVTASQWKRQGFLEGRQLSLVVRLLELFKGGLELSANRDFQVEVEQTRESEFSAGDYHGLWSHLDPEAGVRYLVFAIGNTTSGSALMQEPSCRSVLSSAFAPDVRAAIDAEHGIASVNEPGESSEVLFRIAEAQRSTLNDLFGRYLWARLKPAFLKQPNTYLPRILALTSSRSLTTRYRESLLTGLSDALMDLDEPKGLVLPAIRAMFSIVYLDEASPMRENLVSGHIYNLLFVDSAPRFHVNEVLDAKTRRQVLDAIRNIQGDRSEEIRRWLKN